MEFPDNICELTELFKSGCRCQLFKPLFKLVQTVQPEPEQITHLLEQLLGRRGVKVKEP